MINGRKTDPPCFLTTSEYAGTADMERTTTAQALKEDSMTSHKVPAVTMEANPKHSIMKELKKNAEAGGCDSTLKDLIWLLFDATLLTSGFDLDEPAEVAERIHRIINLSLSIDGDLPPPGEVDDAAGW